MATTYQPDIEAEITFVSTEQGGRKSPAFSGYRPQFYYDGMDWAAQQEYPDVEKVLPGQTVRTLLTFFRPEAHFGRVFQGMEFTVREGSRTVAHGKVTKILRLAELEKKAQKPLP